MTDVIVTGTGRWPQPFKPALPTLAPGMYTARITKAALAIDPATGEDWLAMVFATLSKEGVVMIESITHLKRQKPMIRSLYDIVEWPVRKPPHSLRYRHYKAKPQPNCGPRSNNPW